jgi:hypothetical protein
MLWVDRLLAGAGVLREVAWGSPVRFICGSSGVPLLLLGFIFGFSVGIGFTLAAIWIFLQSGLASIRRRTRLAGYLDLNEQRLGGRASSAVKEG